MTDNPDLARILSEAAQSLNVPSSNGTARSAQELRGKFDKFMQDVDAYAAQLKKRVVGEVFARVVQDNPVGERGKWRRNLGKPESQWQPKGYVGGQSRNAWRISVGAANFAEQRNPGDVLAAMRLEDRVWIVNPMPYIGRLNDGWSKQAPAGWIDRAIQQVLLKYQTQGGTPR